MDKQYQPQLLEKEIYTIWEKGGYFTPKIDPAKRPFTILLPLPNANDPMHMGHALFTIQDILIRYHRMKGDPTLWLPGGDHAGIETQYVFEKKLAKEGKSRFDFDRNTLYNKISDFVEENKNVNKDQMKRLGFSLDWTRYHYSLEPEILNIVFDTFRKLYQDGLIYRAEKIVNFCTFCGTAFSDLEINYIEKDELLYFLDYGLLKVATTRPETIFADVAVAVNPQDKRYQQLIGKEATIPLINKKVTIIADEAVEKDFGTGALKITPAHDKNDFEIGVRHKLPLIACIDLKGKMINAPKEIEGLFPRQARKKTIELLEKTGKLVKTEPLHHTVGTCYRCKNIIEPLPIPQWYIKTKPLAKLAIEAVKNGETKIEPLPRFEKMYFDWLENITDWNISRQIVWGPQIPAYYCLNCNPEIIINFQNKDKKLIFGKYSSLVKKHSLEEILKGLQSIRAPVKAVYTLNSKTCGKCQGNNLIQETDTFDTWFLSGQWPFTTLRVNPSNVEKGISDFNYFYPTSVLDTMWDILFFWVGRMMMLGIYRTGKVPFKIVHLHCRVVDSRGQKMSKSRNNVINPLDLVEKYGADSLRMALVFGAAPGSDIALSEDKVRAMRNFANKVWNIGRFLKGGFAGLTNKETVPYYSSSLTGLSGEDKKIIADLNTLIKNTTANLEKYRFDFALEGIYHFLWHRLADEYIEKSKERIKNQDRIVLTVLRHVYLNSLMLLHPFAPFVTETLWSKLPRKNGELLIISSWPQV